MHVLWGNKHMRGSRSSCFSFSVYIGTQSSKSSSILRVAACMQTWTFEEWIDVQLISSALTCSYDIGTRANNAHIDDNSLKRNNLKLNVYVPFVSNRSCKCITNKQESVTNHNIRLFFHHKFQYSKSTALMTTQKCIHDTHCDIAAVNLYSYSNCQKSIK